MKVKNEYTYSACKTNWLRAIHGKIFRSGPKVFEMFNFLFDIRYFTQLNLG